MSEVEELQEQLLGKKHLNDWVPILQNKKLYIMGAPTTPMGDPIMPMGDPITPMRDPTTPMGDPIMPSDVSSKWMTSKIKSRISEKKMATRKTCYVLEGQLAIPEPGERSMPPFVIDEFKNGFPTYWQTIVQRWIEEEIKKETEPEKSEEPEEYIEKCDIKVDLKDEDGFGGGQDILAGASSGGLFADAPPSMPPSHRHAAPSVPPSERHAASEIGFDDDNYAGMPSPGNMSIPLGCPRPPTPIRLECDGSEDPLSEVTGPQSTPLDRAPGSPKPKQECDWSDHPFSEVNDQQSTPLDRAPGSPTPSHHRAAMFADPEDSDIHGYCLNEVTGKFVKDERENVSGLDELIRCENHDEESQGQTDLAMILNEATGVFCYDERQNLAGLGELENSKINNQESVEILAENDDVTPIDENVFKIDSNENESLKKPEYDITKGPKQAKRKNLTTLYAFGSDEKDRSISSVTKPKPGNKKLKVNGLDGSTSVLKNEPKSGKQSLSKFACSKCGYINKRKDNLIDVVHKKILYNCNECGYTTPWQSNLKKHIDGVHKNILHKCDDCDYTTTFKENLKSHIDGLHKKILYNCNECGYTTTWKQCLKRHIVAVHMV